MRGGLQRAGAEEGSGGIECFTITAPPTPSTALAEAGSLMYKQPSVRVEIVFGDGSASSSGGGFMDKLQRALGVKPFMQAGAINGAIVTVMLKDGKSEQFRRVYNSGSLQFLSISNCQ